jgi:hypothetical protein
MIKQLHKNMNNVGTPLIKTKNSTKWKLEKLNKIKTESNLSPLFNSINNKLKFKQNSYTDFKQHSFLNDDNFIGFHEENDEDDFHDAIEEKSFIINEEERPKERRKEIPQRPNSNLNCIEFIKNCVGKSLDEIPVPFNYREPLSMLQRLVEEIEYTDLLDKASKCTNQWEQMAYVAAFSVSCYGTTPRTYKPFNSLLGETFDYDCSKDTGEGVGWKAIAEQISITPAITVLNVESVTNDWHLYHEFSMTSKFRLQYLQVIPSCTTHLVFKNSGHHYTWTKVNTFVHNLVVGKIWIENVGDMDVTNHKTKDVCKLKYSPYNYFSTKSTNRVSGTVIDASNIAHYILNGTWMDYIEASVVLEPKVSTKQSLLKTGTPNMLWKKKPVSYV